MEKYEEETGKHSKWGGKLTEGYKKWRKEQGGGKEGNPILETKNIHKSFGSVRALKGVDFVVNENEVVGLVGDNGAGKSTLIKILAGVLQKSKGEIFWKGEKVEINSSDDSRKLGIETAFQDKSTFDYLTVAENIFVGREITKPLLGPLKRTDSEKMEEEAEKMLRELGIERLQPDSEARFCSGGERQGIVISRPMYFQAELVILDEPTRGLSVAGVERVQEFVRKLKDGGLAAIFITHNLRHVYPVADRFVVLRRGQKIFEAKKKDTDVKELQDAIAGRL